MKKLVVMVLLISLAISGVFANGQGDTGSDSDGNLKVAFIVKDLSNPFFVTMKKGAEDAAKAYGLDFVGLAPEKYAVEAQVRIMEDLVQQQVDGIVIVPIDGAGIVSGVERANAAGIPVFNTNTSVQGGEILGFCGIDHVATGEAAAQFAIDALNGAPGKIVILEGTTGASSARERLEGMHNRLDPHSEIEILASTTAKYNRQTAMQVMEDLLTRFENIDIVLCANDTMALGAKEACIDARRSNIKVAGIDAIPEALSAIEEGELAATVNSRAYEQGYVSTELLCKYLIDGVKPAEVTKVGTGIADYVTGANLQAYLAAQK